MTNCKNCGAPIPAVTAGRCAYCGTPFPDFIEFSTAELTIYPKSLSKEEIRWLVDHMKSRLDFPPT